MQPRASAGLSPPPSRSWLTPGRCRRIRKCSRSKATSVRSTIPSSSRRRTPTTCSAPAAATGRESFRSGRPPTCGHGKRPDSCSSRCPSGPRRKSRWRATPGRRTSRSSTASTTSITRSRRSAAATPQSVSRRRRTLDPASPDYSWTDEGMVIRSYQDKDDWNAIDPNLVLDGDRAWLTWGSFWGGIKMRRVDPLDRQAVGRRHDAALAEQPSARAADRRIGRGPVHRPARRLLVSVRLVRSLLPRRAEHLQRRRRPLARGDRALRRSGAGSQ